ncbi:WecB/TagA/CpsF family glycosyltransferase [Hoeflea sp. CAU 1731]
MDEINASGADIDLVALGVPLQEIWIERNRERLSASLVMGVGAQFDFWSGEVRRAPMLFRKTGMEWLWRLALEPKRRARRNIRNNPEFMPRAWRDRKPDASPVRFSTR